MSNAGKQAERPTTRTRTRTMALAAALAGLVAAAVVTTTAVAARPDPGFQVNPDLQASCGTDVIVILDESGSIDSSNAQGNVASALNAFVTGLQGTNSRMRIVEFSTNARDAQIGGSTAFRDVDASFTADVTTYLTPNLGVPPAGDNTQDPTSYRPWSTTFYNNQIFTNWEAALFEAAAPGSDATGGVGAPLVVFLTDGNPNTVGTAGNSAAGGTNADTASDASIEEMAALQTAGSHVVSMAVGEAVTLPQPFGRLLNLTEPHVPAQVTWNGTGVLNLRTTDGIQVADFSAIDDALRSVVFALCAPSLTLHKSDQDGGDVADWNFSTTVDAMSGGSSLDWVSPADGAATAPTTKTRSTDSSGSTLFQWTPGSSADPELWSSTVYIEETLLPGWTVDPSTYAAVNQNCTVGRLLDDGTVSNFTVDLSKTSPAGAPLPGDTVRYDFVNGNGDLGPFVLDKADIMTCDVRNQAPSSITIAKSATPLSTPDATPFAFTTTSGGALLPLPASFDLDDDGSDTPLPSSVTNTVSPGTFTITETSQDYWDLTAIECTDQTGQVTATPNLQTNSVEIVMPAGGAITCTFNNLQRPQPALNVTKTASPLTFQEKDGSVTYTVLVNNPNGNANPVTITDISDSQQYNSGTAELVDLSVADPPANGVGDVTSNDCNLLIGQVVGTADLTCSFTVTYTGTNAEDDFDDIVKVTGNDTYNFPVSDSGAAHVDVTPAPPQITVDKQNVQPISVVAPGGPATYSVAITNPVGAIETITLTAVTDQMNVDGDPFGGPLDITTQDGTIITATTCADLVGTVLVPGASYSCQFTVDTLAVDPPEDFDGNENLFNVVTVTAEDDDPTPQEVEGSDAAQRTIDTEPPAISVFKTDNGAEIVEPGSTITYDIDISNLGEAESLTIDRIVDEIWFGPGLTPEGTVTIEDDPVGAPIEVTTTLPGPQGATFVSTTCDTLIGTTLDPATGVDAQGVPVNAAATASCQITLDLPANAGDIYNDQVRVDASAPQGGPVSADNSANTPAIGIDPAVTIAKTPDYPTDNVTVPETGGDATFTFEITNSSAASTDPITLNTLTDSVFGDLFDPGNLAVTDISCVALQGTSLAQGATASCQVSAFLSGTVSAPHSNTATITVTDDEGIEAMSSDDGAVGFTNVLPTITLDKTANPEIVSEYGANVTFSVVVTNTSAEPVVLTSLVDSIYGDLSVLSGSGCALGGTIAPNGGTYSCDFTQFVEQDQSVTPGALTHDDTVTAIAQDDEGFDATADDDATVTFSTTPPTVEVTKTDGGVSVDEPGGTVTYTITVENTSQEPVTITTLTDTITYELPFNTIGPINLFSPTAPVTSSTCTLTDLAASDGAPGGPDEMTCSFDVELSGTSQVVSDIVNVTVTDNDDETGDAESPDNTPINDVPPTVQVVKYANGEDVSTRIVPGEEVTYLFEIFNRSTVENILVQSLVDDVFGDLTAECGFDTPTWLTPDDGNDASGTDQTTCTIQRTPVTTPPGLPDYDHINTVTVSAADDEIIRSQGGENPLPSVTDDDSVTVEMREPATISVTKTASPPDTPFDFQLDGGNEQTAPPAAGVYPELTWA
ncbi:MAG: hypothetical protein QNM02_08035, partial [Acidimicrobiia bacterium]|nr:hypothetical protein [Acidimicrobiia bacterium]